MTGCSKVFNKTQRFEQRLIYVQPETACVTGITRTDRRDQAAVVQAGRCRHGPGPEHARAQQAGGGQAAVTAATVTHATNKATADAIIQRTSPARRIGCSTKRHDNPAAATEPATTNQGFFVNTHSG